MARIQGVDLPREKRIEASLQYIYGIGPTRVVKILKETGVDPDKRTKDLTDEEVAKLSNYIQTEYVTEGDLRRDVQQNIRRHMDIATYRGLRHRKGLPCRGQKTKNNSRTRKGRKASIGGKKRK